MILSALFILFGLALIFSEIILPGKYNNLAMEIESNNISEMNLESDNKLQNCYIDEITNASGKIIFGKALYPRFFTKNEVVKDDRGCSLPESGKKRLDFYVIGEQNIWASLALDEPQEPFSNYCDVIVVGDFVRNLDSDLKKGYLPYFQVTAVYVLKLSDIKGSINKISITGSDCDF
jgi:hypothetical protein